MRRAPHVLDGCIHFVGNDHRSSQKWLMATRDYSGLAKQYEILEISEEAVHFVSYGSNITQPIIDFIEDLESVLIEGKKVQLNYNMVLSESALHIDIAGRLVDHVQRLALARADWMDSVKLFVSY